MRRMASFFGEHSKVFDEINAKIKDYALAKGIDYVWSPQKPYDAKAVIEELQISDAGIIDVEPYGEEIFRQLGDKCKLLVRFGVGYDKVDLEAATRHGLCIARTSGSNSMSVADMALSMILAARRQHVINRKTVNSGVWVKNIGSETFGKTIGIIGFGAIGQRLGRLISGFDCEILVYDPFASEEDLLKHKAKRSSVDEIFETCDAISIHVPYSAETHHLVDKKRLMKMKSTSVVVCTARGNIIDEQALYEVLLEKRIAGAGLDVYAQEPLPAVSPLTTLDNIILTPHVSSQTHEAIWETYKKAVDIMDDFYNGRELFKADLLNPSYIENARLTSIRPSK